MILQLTWTILLSTFGTTEQASESLNINLRRLNPQSWLKSDQVCRRKLLIKVLI